MSSAWQIEYNLRAQKQLKGIDRIVASRIVRNLDRDVARHNHPRDFGSALSGEWTGFWRYRVGDYRIICRIEDERVTVYVIEVIEVGHRREVYR